MSLDIFKSKPKSAASAKERLQVIIARERKNNDGPDFLSALQKELIEIISKYAKFSQDDIKVILERKENLEVIEVNLMLPDS